MSAITLIHKRIVVTTPGTAVVLSATPIRVSAVSIFSDPDNAGRIHVGNSTVDSSTEDGIPLKANSHVELTPPQRNGIEEEIDLSKIYIDAETANDAAIIVYFDREQV